MAFVNYAHRGASTYTPENTMLAFYTGMYMGANGIETDVHRTADGKYILIHDDNTKRVAADEMIVEKTTFDTLRNLILSDVDGKKGRTDLRMPTLQEYIQICKKYGKIAVLELKNEFTASDVYKILGAIDKMGYLENTTIISFCLKNLIRLRKRYPDVQAQFLLSEWDDKHMASLIKYNVDLDIKHTAVTAELCKKIHDAGKVINCWTVDTVEDGQRVIDCGIDFITTNILE